MTEPFFIRPTNRKKDKLKEENLKNQKSFYFIATLQMKATWQSQ
jgi:hypothetical protein